MLTRLAINDPLSALGVLDIPVDAEASYRISKAMLVQRLRMRPKQPASTLVRKRILQRNDNPFGFGSGSLDSTAIEITLEAGAE